MMKMCKLWVVFVVAATAMLTSCLGESSNQTEQSNIPGVIRFNNTRMVIETQAFGTLYSPELLTNPKYLEYTDGSCVLVSFLLDLDIPENADANQTGVSTITLYDLSPVDRGQVTYQTDTTTMIPYEIPLMEGGYQMNSAYFFAYIDGTMMLTSGYASLKDQKTAFTMSLDPSQEPIVSSNLNGNVYSVFVRASITTKGTTPTTNIISMQGYNIKSNMTSLNQREKSAGKKEFYLDFYYVEKINSDSTLVWKKEDMPLKVPVLE